MRFKKGSSEADRTERTPRRKPDPARVKELCSDALAILGAGAVAAGTALIYLPAGIIAAGLSAVLLGWLIWRGGDKP